MKNKLGIAILGIFVSIGVLFIISILRYNIKVSQSDYIPAIEMTDRKGEKVRIDTIGMNRVPKMFLFFDPDCEMCAEEIAELMNNGETLSYMDKIYVTVADSMKIADFLDNYPIDKLSNSHVLFDNTHEFLMQYTILSPPSAVLYDSNRKYITTLRGYIKIDSIQKIVNRVLK